MEFLSDPQFWAKWGSIVLLDLVLAGDNALVIALATRTLPPKQQLWGRIWGTLGAVVLRLIFVALVTWLLKLPRLRTVQPTGGPECSEHGWGRWPCLSSRAA